MTFSKGFKLSKASFLPMQFCSSPAVFKHFAHFQNFKNVYSHPLDTHTHTLLVTHGGLFCTVLQFHSFPFHFKMLVTKSISNPLIYHNQQFVKHQSNLAERSEFTAVSPPPLSPTSAPSCDHTHTYTIHPKKAL